MAKYPKIVKLREGQEITLRPMTKDDGDSLFAFFSSISDDDRLFLRDDVRNRDVIDRWCNNIDYERILPILAFDAEGKVVGDATLHVEQYGWWRHLGELRVVVSKECRRQGLGSVMAREIYQAAGEKNLHKLMVQVIESQGVVVRTFERLGFITEARLKDHVTDLNDKKHNLLIMTSDMEELWRKVEDAILDAEVVAMHIQE